MSELAWPIVFMLVAVFGEALILGMVKREAVNWRDLVFNINSGHMMLWLFRGLEVACYGYVAAHWSLNLLAGLPPWLLWLLALLVWDLGFYGLHRLHHRCSILWIVHLVHHQGENFNLSLGVRNSWYSSLTSIPFFLPLAVAGLPLQVFVAVSIFHYTMQFYNHNALVGRWRWLEYVLVTPALHRVHHVNDPRFCHSNFGGTFSFWDRLFGTFQGELPRSIFSYGVGTGQSSENPFLASNIPIFRKLGIAFGRSRPLADFSCSDGSLSFGAILLFVLVIGYVNRYGYGYTAIDSAQILLFSLLALGAIALGGLSEGRSWAIAGWLLVTSLLLAGQLAGMDWFAGAWAWFMLPLSLHGLAIAAGIGRRPRAQEV